jgi:hypothetical protein
MGEGRIEDGETGRGGGVESLLKKMNNGSSRGLTYKALTCFAFSRLAGKFSQRAFKVAVKFKIWYL